MTFAFLEHPSSLEHDTGAHPEQAARITAIERELGASDWLGYERVRSPEVDRAVLTAVHPESYVESLERICAAGGGALDADTIVSSGSLEAALHSAGGAVRLADMLLDGEASGGFSAHRPPGHHAEPSRAMGFCLFNNVAVATRHVLDARRLERVMILDWDVHHGNGTNDIFHSSEQVLFVSIHQSPLYPGTGPARDVGSGPGTGFTVNLPVPPGSGDDAYLSLVEHVAVPLALAFAPELVLISAGYDAHRDDPLASCLVTEAGFAAMARTIVFACRAISAPLGAVLEGGYAQAALGRSVAATMEALKAPAARTNSVGISSIAAQARSRLAEWWPALASAGW
jgi:acetoin utilization deacetylase AcuC-like enzyme